MARSILFIFLLLLGCSSEQQPRLSICAIFKNEAQWLKEWLVYHRNVLKVSHFYLYNDDSTDNYLEILQPYIDQGIVELIDWSAADPSHYLEGPHITIPWVGVQIGAYNDCLKKRALGKTDWVAMIDIDEFIVPVKGVSYFYRLLNRSAKENRGTLSLSWRMFGTSDVEELKEGELLIDKLVWRAEDDYGVNHHVKSIHRPEGVAFCAAHVAHKMEPGYSVRYLHPDKAHVNHYWTRTARYCKMKRNLSVDQHPDLFNELRKVEDRTMAQYVPLIKKEISPTTALRRTARENP